MASKYEVIKDIPEIWESGARVGDILEAKFCYGGIALMNNGKAVCDIESKFYREYCKRVS